MKDWDLFGVAIPWDTKVCEVSAEQFSGLIATLMTGRSYDDDMPKEPKPPVKRRARFFGSEEIEFDHSSPVYLLKYQKYLEDMKAWRINEGQKKDLAVYAPWGRVILRVRAEEADK